MLLATRPTSLMKQTTDCFIYYGKKGYWLIPWSFLFYALNFGIAQIDDFMSPNVYRSIVSIVLTFASFILYILFYGIFLHQTYLMIGEQPHPLRDSFDLTKERFANLAAGFIILFTLFIVIPGFAFYLLLSVLPMMGKISTWCVLFTTFAYIALITTSMVIYIPLILISGYTYLGALNKCFALAKIYGGRVFLVMFFVFWIPFFGVSFLHMRVGELPFPWLGLLAKGFIQALFTPLNFVMMIVIWNDLLCREAIEVKSERDAMLAE